MEEDGGQAGTMCWWLVVVFAGRGAVNHEHVCSWNLKLGDSGGQGGARPSTASTLGGVEAAGSTRGGHTVHLATCPHPPAGGRQLPGQGEWRGQEWERQGEAPVLAGGSGVSVSGLP